MLENNSCNKGKLGVYGGNGCNSKIITTRINNPSGDGSYIWMSFIFGKIVVDYVSLHHISKIIEKKNNFWVKKVDSFTLSWMWADNAGTTSPANSRAESTGVSDGECGLYKICAVREAPRQSLHLHGVCMSKKSGAKYHTWKDLKKSRVSSSVFMISET